MNDRAGSRTLRATSRGQLFADVGALLMSAFTGHLHEPRSRSARSCNLVGALAQIQPGSLPAEL
jgi:hypothetical protein